MSFVASPGYDPTGNIELHHDATCGLCQRCRTYETCRNGGTCVVEGTLIETAKLALMRAAMAYIRGRG